MRKEYASLTECLKKDWSEEALFPAGSNNLIGFQEGFPDVDTYTSLAQMPCGVRKPKFISAFLPLYHQHKTTPFSLFVFSYV